MCHRHLKRNMSNTSPFFRPPKPPLPSHLYLVKRHRHPPSCPKHEPPLGASPFLPSHIQSEAEKRLSLCSLPLLPVLPRRLCPPPSLPWALSVPFPLHCSFSSKNRSSNLGRTINWGEAKSPKDGEALPPLRGWGDGPRRSASCRQVRVRNAVSGGSDSVSAGPRPLPGQLRTCHRTVTRRKHGAAGALRAFVQRMLRENRSRASGPAQTRDPGRGP